MKVSSISDGQFQITDDSDHFVAGPYKTHGEAWRAADRLLGEPISPAEKRAEWIAEKILSSGPMPIAPKKQRRARKQLKAAAKAPRWVRDIAAAKFDPHGNRKHRDYKLGTFGAASKVRHIDPREYEGGAE